MAVILFGLMYEMVWLCLSLWSGLSRALPWTIGRLVGTYSELQFVAGITFIAWVLLVVVFILTKFVVAF